MRVESLQPLSSSPNNPTGLGTFSTLHAGRVAATNYLHMQHHLWVNFQYPPCGSSRCNLPSPYLPYPKISFFQYPPCGSSRCNEYPPCGSSRCNSEPPDPTRMVNPAFSTLHAGRVAATMAFAGATTASLIFQYPPCGSSRCNPVLMIGPPSTTILSVPSMRVESLQPNCYPNWTHRGRDFQYPPCGSSRCNFLRSA